jgi:hypothetical protein
MGPLSTVRVRLMCFVPTLASVRGDPIEMLDAVGEVGTDPQFGRPAWLQSDGGSGRRVDPVSSGTGAASSPQDRAVSPAALKCDHNSTRRVARLRFTLPNVSEREGDMPRRLPVTGKWPPHKDGEYTENHAEHFGFAIQNALDDWYNQAESEEEQAPETADVRVLLDATISNPGGIKEYRATITTG